MAPGMYELACQNNQKSLNTLADISIHLDALFKSRSEQHGFALVPVVLVHVQMLLGRVRTNMGKRQQWSQQLLFFYCQQPPAHSRHIVYCYAGVFLATETWSPRDPVLPPGEAIVLQEWKMWISPGRDGCLRKRKANIESFVDAAVVVWGVDGG